LLQSAIPLASERINQALPDVQAKRHPLAVCAAKSASASFSILTCKSARNITLYSVLQVISLPLLTPQRKYCRYLHILRFSGIKSGRITRARIFKSDGVVNLIFSASRNGSIRRSKAFATAIALVDVVSVAACNVIQLGGLLFQRLRIRTARTDIAIKNMSISLYRNENKYCVIKCWKKITQR
jgi:hypothetical protein